MAYSEQLYPIGAVETTTAVLFAIAILSASVRVGFRIKFHRRLFADDAFLIFACLTLTALFATALYYTPTTFLVSDILNSQSQEGPTISPASVDIGAVISSFRKDQFLRGSLAWITIFAVKFSFLSFFRPLTERLPRLLQHWRVVVAVNVLGFLYCVTSGFLGCIEPGDDALQCLTGTGSKRLSLMIGFATAVDVLTDSLIVSIPGFILWKVRMKLRQKLGIAVFLCLSLCMVVVASVRFSGTHAHANIAQGWEYFWLEVEACVAVCMVSLCAFRSIFASDERRARFKKVRPWYSSTVARLRNGKKLSDGIHDLNNLPAIPSATLSGMRTYIRSWELESGVDGHYRSSDCKSFGGGQV